MMTSSEIWNRDEVHIRSIKIMMVASPILMLPVLLHFRFIATIYLAPIVYLFQSFALRLLFLYVIYSIPIYILTYYFIFRPLRNNSTGSYLLPAVLVCFISIATFTLIPFGLSLIIIANRIDKDLAEDFFNTHGRKKSQLIYSEAIERDASVEIRRFRQYGLLIWPLFFSFWGVFYFLLFLNMIGSPLIDPLVNRVGLLLGLTLFIGLVVLVAVNHRLLMRILPFLPGKEAEVSKLWGKRHGFCLVKLDGLFFWTSGVLNAEIGKYIRIKRVVYDRNRRQRVRLEADENFDSINAVI